MVKQLLLEDVLEVVNKTELRKLMPYQEAGSILGLLPGNSDLDMFHLRVFRSENRFITLRIHHNGRNKNDIVDEQIRLSLAAYKPSKKVKEDFYKLQTGLLNNGVKAIIAKKDKDLYIDMTYDPDKIGLETLRRDMNTIYRELNNYNRIKEKYL
ncbi:MAG: hypothetical protein QXS81_03495 [Candidatus Micrarchaeaceae archaeon]